MKDYGKDIRKQIETNTEAKGYVLLGAAIHNVTDIFSHNVRKKTAKKYGGVWCPVVHRSKGTAQRWLKLADENNKNIGQSERTYLNYLIKNFAIADQRESEKFPVNLEIMYQLAYDAGVCVLASVNSQYTWYDLLKSKLKQAKTGGLKIKDINNQWKILTGEKVKFNNLSEGKNDEPNEIKISYSIKKYKGKRWIEIKAKNACGNSIKVGKQCIYNEDFGGNIVRPSKLKGNQVSIKLYRGLACKRQKWKNPIAFKINYSCKGMKNVRLKKKIKNKEQIATIGKNVVFVPKGEIFEMTKGKKKFKGWSLKNCKIHPNKKKFHVDYKVNKKKKSVEYPANMGSEITLYPVFQ